MVVSLVSLPILLSGLGTDAFGTWVLLQTFSAFTGWFSLADIGTATAATRLVAERASLEDEHGTRTAISSAMATFLSLSVVSALVVAIGGVALFPRIFNTPDGLVHELRVATVFFALQLLVDLLTSGAESCLEGLQRVDLSRGVDAVRRTAIAIATCIVAYTTGSLSGVAAASLLGATIGTITVFIALWRCGGTFVRPSRADVGGLLRYGRVVAVLRPLGVLHRTMDRFIVGWILGPAAVTLVEIATQIQSGAESVLSATSYAVVPSASWLRARGDEGTLRKLLDLGTKYSVLATSAFVTLGIVFAGPFVRVWVGEQFEAAAGLTVVALLYVAVTAPLQVGSNLLLGIGRAGDILKVALTAVIINLAASILLVHAVGIVGCFIGTIIGATFLVPFLGRATLAATGSDASTFVRRAVLPSVWPSAAMAAVGVIVLALPWKDLPTLLIGVPAAGLAFVGATLLWSVSRDELRSARQSIARA
jgi:O-antigen/teichoic acid export membrane protein